MADPFAEIPGIVQTKEEEVPMQESTLLGGPSSAPAEGDEGAYLERFPRRVQSKASNDLKYRMEMEKAVHAAMVELHNVREQLYLVRFDDIRETDDLKKDVQNYLAEIERLEAKVNKLREKMLESFIKSLNLDQISISGALITTQLLHQRPADSNRKKSSGNMDRIFSEGTLAPKDKYGRVMSRHDLEITGTTPGQTLSPGLSPNNQNEESLLRKYSFGLLSVKTPASKASSPQTSFRTPEGDVDSLTVSNLQGRRKLTPDEIANVRANLYSLRQKKELTPAEQNLVEVLTAKLRDQ